MTPGLYPYRDPSLPVAQRVEDLLARMTRYEKIGQLYQSFSLPAWRESIVDLVRKGGIGSRILTSTAWAGNVQERAAPVADINELQKVAVEESRLGIPLIHGRDIIHGHRTVFPIPLAMAATFNPELLEATCAVAAREAASAGVNWTFAPMLDIARDPRWGRIIEGAGEDAYLGERMAEAAVWGFQGRDSERPAPVAACAKHYVGYGAAEGGRDYNTAEISDNTLRNVYLPPFQAAVDAGVATVMSAFHDLNGEPASGSHYLLTEILKQELGFTGFIVSDWASVVELVHHRVATDERAAAKIAFNAGVDMEMVSNTYLDHMESLLESGEVNHERLDDAVRRILTVKFRLGLFEQPYVDPQEASRVQFSDENRALARKAAGQAMVLLQNKDAILPLPKDLPSLAVIGPLASERMALLGSWTLDGLPDETQTLVEAVRAACPQTQVFDVSGSLTDEMLMAAADATAIILAVGESNQRNGEHNNVASLDLPAGQEALVEHVAGLGKPVILVVFAGRPVNLWRLQRFADAILYAWHPGTMGAAAAADVIFGDANPSGRLPVSFPRSEGHIPAHYNHKSTGRSLRYVDSLATPLYPFGYGISYTRFSYSNLSVTPSEIGPAETVTVSVTLTNSGERPGDEVVQCYIQDVVASLTRPVRELKGFQRVSLGPGESAEVQFKLGPRQLSFVGRNNRREVEPGLFLVWVGGDSQAELETRFWVK